jgi:hypothetical protein
VLADHATDVGTGHRSQGYEPRQQRRAAAREEQRPREGAQAAERLEHNHPQSSRGKVRPQDGSREQRAKDKSLGFADNVPAFLRKPARAAT